jgi:UDP-N-acetylglucosamine 4,6-dehydratase
VLEFEDHYVIQPSILFHEHPNYARNALGEEGHPVPEDFEYSSATNPEILSHDALRALLAT